jgi:hypothetical protein
MEMETDDEKQFTCTGRLTLEGVTFFITAKSETEAQEKAKAGVWDDYDIAGSSSADWSLDADSISLNE